MNRINRVTSILIQLQSKKIIPAKEIAQRFNISLRTVYRDIRTLEEAGIPIGSEAGKGYFLVEGFLLPPVMFTAAEVGALITAGKFLNCHGDESFIKDFDSAMYKIKSILKHGEKNYAQELENSINVYSTSGQKNTLADNVIAAIQTAICNKRVPAFLFAMYEKDGMHLEDVLMHMIRVKFLRSPVRKYETENYYETDPEQIRQSPDTGKPKGGKTVAKKEK